MTKHKLRPIDIPEENIALLCKGLGIESDEAADIIKFHHDKIMREYAPKDRPEALRKLIVQEFDRRGIGYRH